MKSIRFRSYILLSLMGSVLAAAQDVSSKITGTVHDPSGAAIAGATVTAHDTAKGLDYPAKTNADGVYLLSPLPIGNYTLKVEAPGFSTTERRAFNLTVDQTARVDVSVTVGQASAVVEVNDAPPLLETDQTFLGTSLDEHATSEIPLESRNYNELTLLSPGAVSLNPGAFTGAQSSFQVGRPYINGNREQTNNYILDGMDNNQIDNNDVAFSPNVDAIQEFTLISQNAPASYGNYIGGVISVTTKSGTNQVHGDVFEFLRNDYFNANTWANGLNKASTGVVNPKPALRYNQFGATLGGPIKRDKLFLFGDYQGTRYDQPSSVSRFTVITAAERLGNFASVCTAGFNAGGLCADPTQQIYNPYSSNTPGGRQPFLFNQINVPFSPAATKILTSSLYPTPINGELTGNQNNTIHTSTNSDQGDVKLDWAVSQKDHIYTRYSQQHISNPATDSQLLVGNQDNEFPLYNGVVDYARTISSNFLNDFRVGGSYFPVTQATTNPTGQNLPAVFGIAGTAPDQTFLPAISFGANSYDSGTAFGNNNLVSQFHDTVVQGQDIVTLVRGQHNINLGFEYYYYKTNILYVGNAGLAGQLGFDGSFTSNPNATNGQTSAQGWSEADFLLGLPATVAVGQGSGRSLRNSQYAGFIQDNWHAATNVTLNLGFRYEVMTPRSEAHNNQTNYNLQSGAVEIAGVDGNSGALYNQYNGPTNYQPRIGIAWQPGGSRYTVVRAAYGISNFSESSGTGNLLFQNPPFSSSRSLTYTGRTQALPGSTLDQGFSGFPQAACTVALALAQSPTCFAGATVHAFDPNDIRPAVSQQYNLSIQHQFGGSSTLQVSYVGQKTDHLRTIALISQKVLNADGTVSPSPYLTGLQAALGAGSQARLTTSTGYSNYNSLQVSFQQRLNHGLEFQANYTYAKCMGNSSGFFAQYGDANAGLTQAGNNHFFFQNTYNPGADYGRCDQNVTDSFNGFVTYALPVGRGRLVGAHMNRAADLAVGGWQTNFVLQAHTGFPITAEAQDASGTGSGFSRADCTGSPVQTPKAAGPAGFPGYTWFTASSVSQPAVGTFGNCEVGSFTGPGLQAVDASVFKDFHIVEHQSLEFRAEAINVLNHPILAAPQSGIGPLFGYVSAAQGERNLQFALKYLF